MSEVGIKCIGKQFGRLVIAYQNLYWTGEKWIETSRGAMLFVSQHTAVDEWKKAKATMDATESDDEGTFED